jgi:hypothetical protein
MRYGADHTEAYEESRNENVKSTSLLPTQILRKRKTSFRVHFRILSRVLVTRQVINEFRIR